MVVEILIQSVAVQGMNVRIDDDEATANEVGGDVLDG